MFEDVDIKVAAILAIAAIECMALYMGMNGTILALAVGAIAGLGGYAIGKTRD